MGTEFHAGANQTIVVYVSAGHRRGSGPARPLSARSPRMPRAAPASASGSSRCRRSPLRHAQAFMARQGSGYETKVAVTVVYATGLSPAGRMAHGAAPGIETTRAADGPGRLVFAGRVGLGGRPGEESGTSCRACSGSSRCSRRACRSSAGRGPGPRGRSCCTWR